MRRVVLGELLHRRSRSLALLLGILVATAAFSILTGTSESQRLEVRGTVARAFRGDYDILVRPRGSRSPFERRSGQVQPNFLSGLFGGISTAQWHEIERLPGVEVAAPIANLGYVLPTASIAIDVSRAAGPRGRALLRGTLTWRSQHGLTRVRDASHYVYVTPHHLRDAPYADSGSYANYSLGEAIPGRRRTRPVCYWGFDAVALAIDGPFSAPYRTDLGCFSLGRRVQRARLEGRPAAHRAQLVVPAVAERDRSHGRGPPDGPGPGGGRRPLPAPGRGHAARRRPAARRRAPQHRDVAPAPGPGGHAHLRRRAGRRRGRAPARRRGSSLDAAIRAQRQRDARLAELPQPPTAGAGGATGGLDAGTVDTGTAGAGSGGGA